MYASFAICGLISFSTSTLIYLFWEFPLAVISPRALDHVLTECPATGSEVEQMYLMRLPCMPCFITILAWITKLNHDCLLLTASNQIMYLSACWSATCPLYMKTLWYAEFVVYMCFENIYTLWCSLKKKKNDFQAKLMLVFQQTVCK